MTYKDMLVHVDNSKACAARLDAAIDLARTYKAHLTALYIIPTYLIPIYAEAQISPQIFEAQREAAQTRAVEAEAVVKKAAAREDIAIEWRCIEGDWAGAFIQHTRYADLVIVGQTDSKDPQAVETGLHEQVLLEAGRPLLFIPYIGVSRPIGKRVIVAWKASREAVRAVNDALPLLINADKVAVITINPHAGEDADSDVPNADICLHLARHGVKAEAHKLWVTDVDVGNLLLSRAADEDADLIVMGAYGHSRFREMILGGATRQMLAQMTVPVFMSH